MVLMRSPRVRTVPLRDRTPVGITLAAGAVTVIGAAWIGAGFPVSDPGWRFAVVPLAVAGFAAASADQVALAGVVLLGWLVTNGFLENRSGELSWHGSADVWVVTALVVAGAVGLAAGDGYRQLRDLRARWLAEIEDEEGRDR